MTVREGGGLSLSPTISSATHAAVRRLPQLRSRIMLGVVGLSAALWLLLAFGMVVNARLATRAEVSASFAIAERFAEARIASIAGFEIVKTNNLPATYGAANLNDGSSTNTYKTLTDAAYNRVRGLIWHRAAVGTVRLLDLSMEMEYQPTKQSTFMVAKYAMGHGVLRPDCAFAVSADDWPDSMSVTTAA